MYTYIYTYFFLSLVTVSPSLSQVDIANQTAYDYAVEATEGGGPREVSPIWVPSS